MIDAAVDKLLSRVGTSYKSIGPRKGRALLHYVVPPPWGSKTYFEVSHSNKLASRLMIKALCELGFDVDNRFYLQPITKSKYDVIIGHGSRFA